LETVSGVMVIVAPLAVASNAPPLWIRCASAVATCVSGLESFASACWTP